MGYIYKITNLTNEKCYIGKTARSYKDRWEEHQRYRNKYPYCNWKLYKMLNSLPEEKVSWEVIEEVSNNELNTREKYWISYYNSKDNGYNHTFGGDGGQLYDYEEIVQYWLTDAKKNKKQVAIHFSMDYTYCCKLLKSLGCETRSWEEINRTNHETVKKSVAKIDKVTGLVLKIYNSITDAAIDLGDENYKKTISTVCRGERPTFQGYCWQYLADIGKPICLNKQIKQIYLPEKNLYFENKELCADWFIENKICRSKNRYTVGGAICYALSHSGYYFGIKIEEKEKVIISHYE